MTTPDPTSFVIPGSNGGSLPTWRWSDARGEGVELIAVHGLGDHGRTLPYRLLAAALAARGHGVLTYDQRGHGEVLPQDQGRANWPDLIDDLAAVVSTTRRRVGQRPVVLLGLSMGAVVVLDALCKWPKLAEAAVLVSAPLGPVTASRAAIVAAKALGKWLPNLPLRSGIDLGQIAADQDLVKQLTADPLFHTKLRAGMAADLLRAPDRIRAGHQALSVPLLFLHGEADRIAEWDDRLGAALPPGRVVVHHYPDGRHNLFLDQPRTQVFADIAAWLERFTPPAR